jgi:hypothetical protein
MPAIQLAPVPVLAASMRQAIGLQTTRAWLFQSVAHSLV